MLMTSIELAYISGSTLSRFVSAAYSCQDDSKYVFELYGVYQTRNEVTDSSDMVASRVAVILGAAPAGSFKVPAGIFHIGFLTIAYSPVHKLSFADTELAHESIKLSDSNAGIFLLMTKERYPNDIYRVDFTTFECRGGASSRLRAIKLQVDNLIDSLEGFTKLAEIFHRSLQPSLPALSTGTGAGVSAELDMSSSVNEIKRLVDVKAKLVMRLVELKNQQASEQSSV